MAGSVMSRITYGLYVLTAVEEGKVNGCIINTAVQQTSMPNRISITVNRQNYTEGMIRRTGKFTLSILDESADFSVFRHFGFQSGKDTDKFADFSAQAPAGNGIPYITEGTNAYLTAEVEQMLDLGSHTMFLARVDGEMRLSDRPSMSYAYYHANVKPKRQPAAAGQLAALEEGAGEVSAAKAGKVWVCQICGYVYDEAKEGVPFEALPDDWTCPLCKHGKADFALEQ